MAIYTHDEAARIIDMFEEVLSRYDIHVPSPEDDERDEDNMVGRYGSVYGDLLDEVEEHLIFLLEQADPGIVKHQSDPSIVKYQFSGNY